MAETLVSDLSTHLNGNYDGIVTENMIADVLAVCPDVDRSDVTKDLKITGSATRTINRILDGQFPAVVSLDTQSTSSDASSQNKESLKTRKVIVRDCTKPGKLVECSSDTEVYTDTDDDDDDVIVNEERTSLFTALKSRFNNDDNSCINSTKDLTTREDINIPTKNSSSSEVIDLSSSDDDNVRSEQKRRVPCQKIETAGNECVVVGSQKHRIWKTLPSDKDNHLQKFSTTISTKKYLETCVDLSQSDSESDSNSDDSTALPCMLPSSCVSFTKVVHETGSESDKNKTGTDSRTKESAADSDEDSRIPCKKKKGSAKRVRDKGEGALLKKKARAQTREAKTEEKEREKLARQQARSLLRNQKEKEKLLKQADKMNQKANRLDTCVKQILVAIDPALLDIGELQEECVLVQKLKDLGAGYNIKPQPTPASVTWQRTVLEHDVGETLQISTKTSFADEAHAVVSLSAVAFVEMVHQSREELNNAISVIAEGDSLRSFCRRALATYSGKIVTIVVLKLEKYFRDVKLAQQRKFRSTALGSSSSDTEKPSGKGRKKSSKETGPSVVVSRVDVEEALVDLQLQEPGCRVRMCETDEEFAELLAMFTKAIAEAPFKKKQPETFSFCVEGADKGSVKISKDGQGLQKVWQQFFQQFRNVSADVAAAIVAVYPTPQSLLQAYKRCRSKEEASKLLKDILVRRGAGVLATSRRIGPELSRRVHVLFTSEDGQMSMQ